MNIALEAIKQQNNSKVARQYGITEGAVRKFIANSKQNEEFISQLGKRKPPSRNVQYEDMEEKLKMWIGDQRIKKLAVSMNDICNKAKEFYTEIYPGNLTQFKASKGWFWRFTKRAHISRRSPTHVLQQLKGDTEKVIHEFWDEITKLRTKYEVFREEGFKRVVIINIDEVPIQLDLSTSKTYHPTGAKMVEVKKTKGTRSMCSALLGILNWLQTTSVLSNEGSNFSGCTS